MRRNFGCYDGMDADDTNPKLRMIRWKKFGRYETRRAEGRRGRGEGEKYPSERLDHTWFLLHSSGGSEEMWRFEPRGYSGSV